MSWMGPRRLKSIMRPPSCAPARRSSPEPGDCEVVHAAGRGMALGSGPLGRDHAPMTTNRISLGAAAPRVYRAIDALDGSVELDPALRELIRIRASQLNGCSYCVDYHSSDARAAGESERRIWALAAWRETPFFDGRE